MAAVDKLLKFLNTVNIASLLDEDQLRTIANDVTVGYEIDQDSRIEWLDRNLEAMDIIHQCEKGVESRELSKVIYPLLAPAVIQLASRLSQHITRNDRVAETMVLGEDKPLIDFNSGQPIPGKYVKQDKAERVSAHMSY